MVPSDFFVSHCLVHIPDGRSVFSQECRVSVRAAHHLPISWPTEFLQGILTFQDMKSANKRRPPCYWHTQKVFSSSAIFQQIFNQFSIRFFLSDVKKAICLYLLSNQLMHSFFSHHRPFSFGCKALHSQLKVDLFL